ncbi:MAG TPA: hypothetical protein VJQ25_04540 [Nitrospira sp.]|nr:hypothetical protein [Nitrospira sp.]
MKINITNKSSRSDEIIETLLPTHDRSSWGPGYAKTYELEAIKPPLFMVITRDAQGVVQVYATEDKRIIHKLKDAVDDDDNSKGWW